MMIQEVEALLGRGLSADETAMLVRMMDAGKSAEDIAKVLAEEVEPEVDDDGLRVVRFEGHGGQVYDISGLRVE